jgi:putative tryptophan/tyrosine transport system substrate-binding protein
MKRRAFMGLVIGGAIARPLALVADQAPRHKTIAALWPFEETDVEGEAVMVALNEGLKELGWAAVRIESRWGGGDAERTKAYAEELVRMSPDIIFAYFNAQLGPLSRATHTIPIVFVGASDPVGAGYVASLAHPGGNITGFTLYEAAMAGKWLGALKEVVPGLSHVALLVNPDTAVLHGTFYTQALESTAAAMGVTATVAKVFSAADIESTLAALTQHPVSGLIVAPDTFAEVNGDRIVALSAQYRVPTVCAISRYARRNCLMSYGPNLPEVVKQAASYIDRILRGEKAADLPVQTPVKYDLIVNLKTAKAFGLSIPEAFLLRADEVIE